MVQPSAPRTGKLVAIRGRKASAHIMGRTATKRSCAKSVFWGILTPLPLLDPAHI